MKYLLDTNICIYYLRGKYDLDVTFKNIGIENLNISEITVFELKYGAELSDNKKKSHEILNKFLGGLSVLPIFSSLDLYSKEKVRLRKIGKPIHDEFDFLIGLTADVNNLVLVTENIRDFKNIENIKIENWIIPH